MSGKKFRFSLESVLRLRKHETETARQDLALIRKQVHEQEAHVSDTERYLKEVISSRTTGATGRHHLSRYEAYRREAQHHLDEARKRLARLKDLEHEARIAVMEKKGAEEAMEQLKEQERDKHWREHLAAETRILDDQAISSYQKHRMAANS